VLADPGECGRLFVLDRQRVEHDEVLPQPSAELPGHLDELRSAFPTQVGDGIA